MTAFAEVALYCPLIDNCQYGAEPNIQTIVKHYYLSRGIEEKKAQELMVKYVEAVNKHYGGNK